MLAIFCMSESVALIIPNVANVFTKLYPSLQETFETAAQTSKEPKRTEFDGAFCKKFKLLIDRFSSFFR